MEIRPATWEDIESVIDRLSDQNRAEYEYAGGVEGFKGAMFRFMVAGETNVLCFDGKPQAVLSIKREPEIGPVTWLIVTKELFEKGIAGMRVGRQYMRDAVARYGEITSFVSSKHPDVDRWMAFFGAKLVGTQGPTKIFLFEA